MPTNHARPDGPRNSLIAPLTLAGALPFIAAAAATWLKWPLPIAPEFAVAAYGAVILSFLGGIHWSFFLNAHTPKPWVIILSNVLALLGWVAVLGFEVAPRAALIALAGGFGVALWVDYVLWRQGFVPLRFLRLRQWITAIVASCLLATALA